MANELIEPGATLLTSTASDEDASAKQGRRLLWFPLALSASLLILPQLTFVTMSFHRDIGMGQVSADFTMANYTQILTDVFYLRAIWETTYLAACATFWAVILAFPTAYWLVSIEGPLATILLTLILASSLITVPIKLMGLDIILGPSGIVNRALEALSIIQSPVPLLNNDIGVLIGLIQYTVPILVLMLFAVVQTIPRYLEEAAHIHGASNAAAFFQVTVPMAKQGILGAGLLSFNMCMGAFTSPLILGGGRVLTLPVLIQQKIIDDSDYGLGAALSVLLACFVLLMNIAVGAYVMRKGQRRVRRPQRG
jgi:putative spermidine/putrescine transport system permease protein